MKSLKSVGDDEVMAELSRRVAASKPVPPQPEQLPEPAVRARPATDAEVARANSCRLAAVAAVANDWASTTHYACGPLLGAKQEILELEVESIVLKARKHGLLLVASWICRPSMPKLDKKTGLESEQWSLDCAWLAPPIVKITGNDIRPILKSSDLVATFEHFASIQAERQAVGPGV